MKNHPITLLALILAAALPATTGCSKESPRPPAAQSPAESAAPTPPPEPPAISAAPVSPPDPCVEMKAALALATLEQHAGLGEIQQRMDREIDALVMAKKAEGADVSLAADEKLDSATEDFAEKLRMLSVARPETWDSAKHNTELSLQNVRAAFIEVMNSPPRK
jgi:hypothetical protein